MARCNRVRLVSALVAIVAPLAAHAQPASSKLVLEAVEVTPATAAAETLCHLRARIKNTGSTIASGFVFGVSANGREIAVYRNHVFMDPIEPGETRSLRLYGLWTSETGRPFPATGDLVIEVSLLEARWMSVAQDPDGTLVWSDRGAVDGLPLSRRQTVELKRP